MRARVVLPLAVAACLIAPAAASADFAHVVLPGESLSSVAAVDGLSVDQLAAANGVSPDASLVAGTTLMIPPQGGSSSTVSTSSGATSSSSTVRSSGAMGDGDTDSDDTGTGASTSSAGTTATSSSSSAGGSYIVQPGDTLSAIAARAGTTVDQLAAANGLEPNGLLQIGAALSLGGGGGSGGSSSAATGQPVGASAQGAPGGPPYPTPEQVTASQVGDIAAANGVPPSLAKAIGFQESGFNNDLVSGADARGVMQILPGTWSWINGTLASRPLSPASAASNVTGGVLLLRSLLNATGGDQALAAAGYYQGLPSVQQHGMYSDTQQYVNNVMSLTRQFGGG